MNAEIAIGTSLPPGVLQHRIADFLFHEARLLDERRFEEWMELFTEDGYYWAPARPDQENPYDESSLFFDDRQLMAVRIRRLRHPRIHVQTPPSRTCHYVTNVMIDAADEAAGAYGVSSCFLMLEYRKDNQRVFGGRCEHHLVRGDAGFRIAMKKATLINCDSVFDALAIPF